MLLPKLAITMGDPAGIGPEVIAKALPHVLDCCRPVLIGEDGLLRRACARYLGEDAPRVEALVRFAVPERIRRHVVESELSLAERGQMQFQCVELAVHLVRLGEIDGIVTAPITKEALAAAGCKFPGHTELLADLTKTHPPVMMLQGPKLRVVPLTTHVPLGEVPALLTRELVEVQIRILHRELRRLFGIEEPRIALAALNPHAGESGLFGREEIEVLAPSVSALRASGIDVQGPLPADTAFVRALRGEFDVVAAPTHDQALIPLKLLHFDDGVNVTLGLPLIRTSPDHGTAPDIAGRGVASPASMIAAIRTAAAMADRVHTPAA